MRQSYKTKALTTTSYRKLRTLLGKPIRETAQDTLVNAIKAGITNINSQQALINIGVICCEKFEPKMETVFPRTVWEFSPIKRSASLHKRELRACKARSCGQEQHSAIRQRRYYIPPLRLDVVALLPAL